jgi:CheY-like chemotaxis protein
MNLVINASEALEEKNGVICIRTGTLQADRDSLDEAALATDLAPGDYVFLEVSDTGCGMDRETLSRIFDPFFTTKFIGRGLGLAAVSGIVRAHGGALQITSEPARGSKFRILLPCCPEPAEPIHTPSPMRSQWQGQGTVLVADDEEGVRVVTTHMLKTFGFDVLQAADGEEAVALFREEFLRIVAVVLDLTMPRLSGEETLRQIRRIRPEAPVLLMSGFSEQDAMQRVCAQGASDFLAKPFKPEELREKMQAILEAPLGEVSPIRFGSQ